MKDQGEGFEEMRQQRGMREGVVWPAHARLHAPQAGEWEEKSISHDGGEGIRERLLALRVDGHARGEGTDAKGGWAGERVCGGYGHGSDECALELRSKSCYGGD